MRKTDILDVISRKLAPFILMFGFYVVTHGHLSPGGGFQGGVVLASAVVLLFLCHDPDEIMKLFPKKAFLFIETGALFAFLMTGLTGMLMEGNFLALFNFLQFSENQTAGFLFLLNIIIGLKVGAGISLVCYYFFRKD
ncbi:MnhB domain-containing protein [Chitinispirillales bacterium ANBcel5]|uniref:MnhB domain-containing protein n=1 Tax=Cellulosispirillum alkaliphilum TaxID=3039283 RepID=UPI002A56B18B|nr:MnhB domain-containing protein [Chitinispirillales bacterium ANBcel5]